MLINCSETADPRKELEVKGEIDPQTEQMLDDPNQVNSKLLEHSMMAAKKTENGWRTTLPTFIEQLIEDASHRCHALKGLNRTFILRS